MEENIGNLIGFFKKELNLQDADVGAYSPLVLAYIGDCIYDLVIRTIVVEQGNAPVNKLHRRVSHYVKASAQKELYYRVKDMLTEEEMAVFKRGRNAKSYTMAKNATMSDYRTSTGVEALVGYLYMSGDLKRVVEIIKKGLQK